MAPISPDFAAWISAPVRALGQGRSVLSGMLNGGCGEGSVLSGLCGGLTLYVRGCGLRLKLLRQRPL
jgi:hypothetical protein